MGKLLKLALCALMAIGIGSAWAQQAARLARIFHAFWFPVEILVIECGQG